MHAWWTFCSWQLSIFHVHDTYPLFLSFAPSHWPRLLQLSESNGLVSGWNLWLQWLEWNISWKSDKLLDFSFNSQRAHPRPQSSYHVGFHYHWASGGEFTNEWTCICWVRIRCPQSIWMCWVENRFKRISNQTVSWCTIYCAYDCSLRYDPRMYRRNVNFDVCSWFQFPSYWIIRLLFVKQLYTRYSTLACSAMTPKLVDPSRLA